MNIIFIEDKSIIRQVLSEYIKYLENCSTNVLSRKTNKVINTYNFELIMNIYLDNCIQLSTRLKHQVTDFINKIRNKYSKYPFVHSKWKFIAVKDIEISMPFTLQDCIFITENLLQNSNITNILIHEKIHTIQRKLSSSFYNLYTTYLGYIPANIIITKNWKKLIFVNPDGVHYQFVFPYLDKFFLPMLILNVQTNLPEEIVILLKKENNQYITTNTYWLLHQLKNSLFKDYPKNISLYHPNEISAEIIATIITNNNNINHDLQLKFKYITDLL